MEHGEPSKEVVPWSEILQTYVIIHTPFTWRSCVTLVQMSFELLGNGDVIHYINFFFIYNSIIITSAGEAFKLVFLTKKKKPCAILYIYI
jgi:hypothetical protein